MNPDQLVVNKAFSLQAAAAEKKERREKASNLDGWLLDFCGIDDEEERTEVLDTFVEPRYTFRTLEIYRLPALTGLRTKTRVARAVGGIGSVFL